MKRSVFVSLSLVPAVAAWFTACGETPPPPTHQQVCADQGDRIVEDRYCVEQGRQGGGGASWAPGSPHVVPYHWYYMPYRAGGYPLGYDGGGGGSYVAPVASGGNPVRVSQGRVVTGGFGSTASSGGIGA